MHVIVRPVLAGFVAGIATFFVSDYVCRVHVWPATLAGTAIVGNERLRHVRVSHRLVALWLAVSVVPLAVVTLTTSIQVVGLDLRAHALLARVAAVVLLTAISAEILTDAVTADRARDRFDMRRLGSVSLKNVSSPVEVWEVGARRA